MGLKTDNAVAAHFQLQGSFAQNGQVVENEQLWDLVFCDNIYFPFFFFEAQLDLLI